MEEGNLAADGSQFHYRPSCMDVAFAEAEAALSAGEVPVGCAFVDGAGTVVARGHNLTNAEKNALAHAEFVAFREIQLREASNSAELSEKVMSSHRFVTLEKYDLYVTVEPCIMCAAMLLYRRIRCVFFGCGNPRFGGNGTILAINAPFPSLRAFHGQGYPSFGGHCAERSVQLLQRFYSSENELAPEHKRRRKDFALVDE